MKRDIYILFVFFIAVLTLYAYKVEAVMPLTGRVIVIDPGHGAEDPGTSYKNILEKNINLSISKELEMILGTLGAEVLLTRDGDYDLSNPNANYRKKSDFDNRIKLINSSEADLYLSIHLNYLNDSYYYGPQVFYNSTNRDLAVVIQNSMNLYTKTNREIKLIPSSTYMYNKIEIPGILIECGFLSNTKERTLLVSRNYQRELAKSISLGVVKYFSS